PHLGRRRARQLRVSGPARRRRPGRGRADRLSGAAARRGGAMTRVALVTGASRGIGAAIARELAAAGCHVLINYRSDAGGAAEVRDGIAAAGGAATLLPFDVCDAAAATAALAPFIDGDRAIDVVVNNAGVVRDNPLPALLPEDWERVTRTSLDG